MPEKHKLSLGKALVPTHAQTQRDFYGLVRKAPSKREWQLPLFLSAAVLFLACMVGLVLWAGFYISRYRRFVKEISNSTVYAYDNGGFSAFVNGEELWLKGESAYSVYRMVTNAGMGRQAGALPDDAADGVLLYGDGAVLSLWEVELEGEMTPHGREEPRAGVLLFYESADGWQYAYDTPKLNGGRLFSALRSAAGREF